MTRATYSAWLFGTIGVVGGLIWATFACLTELADVVAPLGVNATVAQNAIIIAAVAVGYLVLSGASARRAATVRGWRSAEQLALHPYSPFRFSTVHCFLQTTSQCPTPLNPY
ncbi:MAG: hypothetical protein AAFR23_01945 [Pseudomonadota bacterium]